MNIFGNILDQHENDCQTHRAGPNNAARRRLVDWLILAGSGWGKTRKGAEWVRGLGRGRQSGSY